MFEQKRMCGNIFLSFVHKCKTPLLKLSPCANSLFISCGNNTLAFHSTPSSFQESLEIIGQIYSFKPLKFAISLIVMSHD